MTNIPTAAQYPKDVLFVWNDTNQRREIWHRCGRGDRDWVLLHAWPCRKILESFIGPLQAFAGLVGLQLDNSWACNGDPAPAAGNFIDANGIGGGLILRCLGAAVDDWIAFHTGANYPVTIEQSPHLHATLGLIDITGVYGLVGLVGAVGLETGNGAAWTRPDDGIWIEYDTDIDTQMRFVTRRDGVESSTNIGVLVTDHPSFNMRVNDAGTQVEAIFNGTIVATHITNLPTIQLKPLFMEGSRAGGAVTKEYHCHDFRLIFDHGGLF